MSRDCEDLYTKYEWSPFSTEAESTTDAFNHFSTEFSKYIKRNKLSLLNKKIHIMDCHNDLKHTKLTLYVDEITKHNGLFDGIFIPVNKKDGIVTKDSNFITNFYGAIELKKTDENFIKKKSKAHFSQLTGQPFAQLIVANANTNKPVFLLITDLNGNFNFWYFDYDAVENIVYLKQYNELTAENVFKMIHFWLNFIINDSKTDDAKVNCIRDNIFTAFNHINLKYNEIKSKSIQIPINSNDLPVIEDCDDCEPTDEQVNTNTIIFNYIRDHKYMFE